MTCGGVLVTILVPQAALAHPAHGLLSTALSQWVWDIYTIVLLCLSAAIYTAGVRAMWRNAGRGRGTATWQVVAFALGLLTLAIALLSPVAWLSAILFSAHMTQHEILMLVSAPLLVLGQPLVPTLWAMPRRWRQAAGRFVQRPAFARAWRTLTSPISAFTLHAIALWIWHVPVLYEAALRHDGIHALQHASFLLTAVLFWWGMTHGRYGRTGYGLAVLYVFLTAVHSSILGALMTIAPRLWYPFYEQKALEWQIDPLHDQQLAGLLMWVPSGALFVVFGLALFAAWLGESERRALLGQVHLMTRTSAEHDVRRDPGHV